MVPPLPPRDDSAQYGQGYENNERQPSLGEVGGGPQERAYGSWGPPESSPPAVAPDFLSNDFAVQGVQQQAGEQMRATSIWSFAPDGNPVLLAWTCHVPDPPLISALLERDRNSVTPIPG